LGHKIEGIKYMLSPYSYMMKKQLIIGMGTGRYGSDELKTKSGKNLQ